MPERSSSHHRVRSDPDTSFALTEASQKRTGRKGFHGRGVSHIIHEIPQVVATIETGVLRGVSPGPSPTEHHLHADCLVGSPKLILIAHNAGKAPVGIIRLIHG